MAHHSPTLLDFIPLIVIIAVLALGFFYLRNTYSGPNGKVIVRCQSGHLFTTTWIPFISFKAIRLGLIRFQRGPVGNHWTLVTPVRESELTDEERLTASQYSDGNIP